MAFTITLADGCHLPMIGFNVKEFHDEWEEQLDWVLQQSDRYFEVPISGHLSEAVMRRIGRHAHKERLMREDFIISTSITVPEDVSAAVSLVKEFVAHFGTHIDLLYLENPVGLKGTDPMTIYNTSSDGTHPEIHRVTHMFRQMPDGRLRVTPRIVEDLRMLWDVLEVELVATGTVHSLGLRHFSQEQVERLLKAGIKHHPLALQAEVNPYCDQYELRSWCQEANIPLVGIHPYGNPLHVPSKDMPLLWEHPKVIKIAERVGVGPKVILSRHVLQSRLRMVYNNTELLLPNFMTENIWRFHLTHGQVNKLGKLSKLPQKYPLSKYELLCVVHPYWPFFFVGEREKKGEGKKEKVKEEEAEHKVETKEEVKSRKENKELEEEHVEERNYEMEKKIEKMEEIYKETEKAIVEGKEEEEGDGEEVEEEEEGSDEKEEVEEEEEEIDGDEMGEEEGIDEEVDEDKVEDEEEGINEVVDEKEGMDEEEEQVTEEVEEVGEEEDKEVDEEEEKEVDWKGEEEEFHETEAEGKLRQRRKENKFK